MSIYTGHVDPGAAPGIRELGAITIAKMSVGPMDNNTYLLTCRSTGAALLIDAAAEADRILDVFVDGSGPGVRAIVTTHRHGDHWQALAAVAAATDATTYAGDADADGLPIATDRRLHHGDTIPWGDQHLMVIALRGHTPGSVALHYDGGPDGHHLFTGDSLFPGGVGRTGSPADFRCLLNDVEARIFDALADGTWVYPGHGDDTTLAVERPHLPEWRARGW